MRERTRTMVMVDDYEIVPQRREEPLENLEVHYVVEVSDLIKANYYGFFLRQRKALRVSFGIFLAAMGYGIFVLTGLIPHYPWIWAIVASFFVWVLLQLAWVMLVVLRYVRSDKPLIGVGSTINFMSDKVTVVIPAREIEDQFPYDSMTYGVELSSMFLLYPSPTQAFILPHRSYDATMREAIAMRLRNKLGEKFSSRFNR